MDNKTNNTLKRGNGMNDRVDHTLEFYYLFLHWNFIIYEQELSPVGTEFLTINDQQP